MAPFMGWFSEELSKSCEPLDLIELEGIAKLSPQYILIDTHCSDHD